MIETEKAANTAMEPTIGAHNFVTRKMKFATLAAHRQGVTLNYPSLIKTFMPIISTFFGIIIRMYFGDHNPPHFHVEFQGEKATFSFDGQLLVGSLSSATARKLVRDWARRHRLELMINWRNIENGRPLNRIKPLE